MKLWRLLFLSFFIVISSVLVGQNIRFLSIENTKCMPLMHCPENLVFNYETISFGHVGSFLKLQEDNFLLFRDRQEFRGPGKIMVPFERLNRLMETKNNRSFNLLLTHVSRDYKYSEDVTSFYYDYSAPYGTELLSLPVYPDLLRTNYTYRTREVNYGALFRIVLGVGLGAFGIHYGNERDLFKNESNEMTFDDLIVASSLVGGILISVSGYERRYNYYSFPDTLKNDKNSRINMERITTYEREIMRIEAQNQKIKQTYIIRILIK